MGMRTAQPIEHWLAACFSSALALGLTCATADAAGGARGRHNALAPTPAASAKIIAPSAATAGKNAAQATVEPPALEAAATAKSEPSAQAWTPTEVADAKARCDVIFSRIEAVAVHQAPLKEGSCGTPAPIQLISIGRNPEVAISPPAIITCDMAEGLFTWLKKDLQPLAKRHLGGDIIKIETMSDYSCRMAYGRVGGKLSEHGHANALDIRGFVTSSAKTAYVLENWGKPQREIREEMIAAKAAAERAEAQRIALQRAADAAKLAARSPVKTTPTAPIAAAAIGATAAGIAKSTIVEGTPKLEVQNPTFRSARDASFRSARDAPPRSARDAPPRSARDAPPRSARDAPPALSLAPEKLGGPKVLKVASPPVSALSQIANKAEFLHAAHEAACLIFGTTLGPEANSEHRNHFHVDMAARKTTKICN